MRRLEARSARPPRQADAGPAGMAGEEPRARRGGLKRGDRRRHSGWPSSARPAGTPTLIVEQLIERCQEPDVGLFGRRDRRCRQAKPGDPAPQGFQRDATAIDSPAAGDGAVARPQARLPRLVRRAAEGGRRRWPPTTRTRQPSASKLARGLVALRRQKSTMRSPPAIPRLKSVASTFYENLVAAAKAGQRSVLRLHLPGRGEPGRSSPCCRAPSTWRTCRRS